MIKIKDLQKNKGFIPISNLVSGFTHTPSLVLLPSFLIIYFDYAKII